MIKIISRNDAKDAGLKRYFTGEPCPHGHISERRVSDYGCIECCRLKAASSSERERRKEYMRQHMRKWRAENREHANEALRKSYAKHREKRVSEVREKRAKNPDAHKAALRRSYHKNKTRRSADMKRYRQENKELIAFLKRARKAKIRASEGTFSGKDIDALFETQGGKCTGCGTDIAAGYHIDHVHPISRGGTNWPSNLQLLCQCCNLSKGAKTMKEWLSARATNKGHADANVS